MNSSVRKILPSLIVKDQEVIQESVEKIIYKYAGRRWLWNNHRAAMVHIGGCSTNSKLPEEARGEAR